MEVDYRNLSGEVLLVVEGDSVVLLKSEKKSIDELVELFRSLMGGDK